MAGIYIHVPFCRKKCSYCDFHFSTNFEGYRGALISKIGEEIAYRKDELPFPIETIYFGGGTPSILHKEELKVIWDSITHHYDISSLTEVTLEVNPEDVNEKNLSVWKSLGVNRLSIGIQSLKESDLRWMNRAHDTTDGFRAVEMAKEFGFEKINVDVIYGLPDLSMAEWSSALEKVVLLPIDHISAYCLTVEKKTALNNFVERGQIVIPTEDAITEQFEVLVEKLSLHGFMQYEVSNFARDGREAVHNTNYWRGVAYSGFGPSAHSFNGTARRWNIANNLLYNRVNFSEDSWYEEEMLSTENQWNELFLTGLRTKWGVSKEVICRFGGLQKAEALKLEFWGNQNCITESEYSISLTRKGMLLADKIAQDFFRLTK